MNLSPHFTLAEFVVSDTAARRGIENDPPADLLHALKRTAQGMEAVRVRLEIVKLAPATRIIVTSGYRSPALNAAVGGQPSSQHTRGEAADFIAPRFGSPTEVAAALRDSVVDYDQLILEFGRWVHISFSQAPRHQALVIDARGTRPMFG